MWLSSSDGLIAAAASVVLLTLVFPALVIVVVRARRSACLSRLFAKLPERTRQKLLRQPALLDRKAATRSITYLCCELDAALDEERAEKRVKHTGALIAALIEAVLSEGGTLDFRSTRNFAAYWNAPLRDADHAAHACAAAARMSEIIAAHNLYPLGRARQQKPWTASLRIGLASGSAVTGIFGETYLVEGAVPRSAVALAYLCERLGYEALAENTTRDAADAMFAFLELRDDLSNPETTGLYALLGNRAMRASPKFRAVATFHSRIFAAVEKADWAAASTLLAQARILSGASGKYYDALSAQIAALKAKHTLPAKPRRVA